MNEKSLSEMVSSLVTTVARNMFNDTVRACAKQWGFMDEDGKWKEGCLEKDSPIVYPPPPEVDTIMKDGYGGTEKDFTKFDHDQIIRSHNLISALTLIAAPMRPDGTWNRDRGACQKLAEEAMKEFYKEA